MAAATEQLTEEEIAWTRSEVVRDGLEPFARRIRLSAKTIIRCLSGLPVARGTAFQLRIGRERSIATKVVL